MDCAFCRSFEESKATHTIIGETAHAIAWLHESGAHRGHSVVVSRRHCENLADLDETEAADFLRLERAVERAVLDETETRRAILMKLGLQVPHLHIHIYPFGPDSDRTEVMSVIDGKVTDKSTVDQKREFALAVKISVEKELAR